MYGVRNLLVVLVLLVLLGVRGWVYIKDLPEFKNGERFEFTARLREEPELNLGRQEFAVKEENGRKIHIITTAGEIYHYGDKLNIDGTFTVKKYGYYMYFPKMRVDVKDKDLLAGFDVFLKKTGKNVFGASLPQSSSALLQGMIFGGNQGMPKSFLSKLRDTGVIHVIAASGMNVTFVACALMALLGRIMKRQWVLVLTIVGAGVYAFIAGFEPSIVRATLMVAGAMFAGLLGRKYWPVVGLVITGYVMLMYRPTDITDIGFQLSFLSTLGILIINPLIPGNKFILADDFRTTLAAQIATMPVLLAAFGQVGLLSLLVNISVLWTVPFLMVFGTLGVAAGSVNIAAGQLFGWIALPFLYYFETVVSFAAGLGWVWKVEGLGWEMIVGYYLVVGAVVLYVKKVKNQKAKVKSTIQNSKF